MKQAFRLSRPAASALALVLLVACAVSSARAQTASATPDTFVFQIANTVPVPPATPAPAASPSPSPTPFAATQRNTFAQDISADGRFVVMESTGDIATNRSDARNNVDGNVEIFLFDYAQRRIYQITDTKNAVADAAQSPQAQANIVVEVRNLRPQLSRDGRFIVFASNAYSDANPALTPKKFDGEANEAALKADGNMEIFIYRIPDVAAADLTAGTGADEVDLTAGTMTRVTNTPASRVPTAGTATAAAFIADDNRAPAVSDDGSYVAFISTRNISNVAGSSNSDANPEVFIWNRTSPSFVQATVTSGAFVFNDNPSLSGDGTVLAFFSTADINTTEPTADRGNGEIYVANFNGTIVSNLRQVTKTPTSSTGTPVNVLSPGRRLSRNGQFLAFESIADFASNGTVNGALKDTLGTYLVRLSDLSFTQVASRPPATQAADVLRFPTFTGDSTTVVFASTLNLRATTGEALAENSTEGLNPALAANNRPTQIWAVAIPAAGAAPANYQRVSRIPTPFAGVQPFPSDTVRRMTFTPSSPLGVELGGGNADGSSEAFYQFVPAATSEPSGATVSFLTGASERPVVAPSPAPTPPAVAGLAPGMLGIARSATALAPSEREVDRNDAVESGTGARRPPLPVELNGVSVSVAGAAAGLYFVSPGQINFVVPPGLITTTTGLQLPVVINNNGAVIRTTLGLNPAQPDIGTSSNGPGGRAAVVNVTNPCVGTPGEPFTVTTTRPVGSASGNCSSSQTETVATHLLIMLTGVRNATTSQVTVRIGTTDLTGTAIVSVGPSRTSGFDQIEVVLPASLAGAGDVPVIVTVTATGGTFTSRPADTAPHITIQ